MGDFGVNLLSIDLITRLGFDTFSRGLRNISNKAKTLSKMAAYFQLHF